MERRVGNYHKWKDEPQSKKAKVYFVAAAEVHSHGRTPETDSLLNAYFGRPAVLFAEIP